MRTPITLISSILILNLFANCASSQFDKKPPFTIAEAKYQKWIGGKQDSKGTMVTLKFAEKIDDNIEFDSIYFNNRATAIKSDLIDYKTVIYGNFVASNIADKNIIMDADPKKEFGNKPPLIQKKSPFELGENECVIGYTFNNKKHYFKLDKLQKGKTIINP